MEKNALNKTEILDERKTKISADYQLSEFGRKRENNGY